MLLHRAFEAGCHDAKIAFDLESEGDKLTPLMGAVPIAGPALAGVTSGMTAPKRDSGIASGLVSGGSSLIGGLGGSVLGALLGIPAGLLLHHYDPVKYKLPTDSLIDLPTVKEVLSKGTRVGQGVIGGTAAGGILGSAAGAHVGRQAMKSKEYEE